MKTQLAFKPPIYLREIISSDKKTSEFAQRVAARVKLSRIMGIKGDKGIELAVRGAANLPLIENNNVKALGKFNELVLLQLSKGAERVEALFKAGLQIFRG